MVESVGISFCNENFGRVADQTKGSGIYKTRKAVNDNKQMVDPSSRVSATAIDRAARVGAFRSRIDGLRATSRVYDLPSPSCGRSVNTLGSGSTLESSVAPAGAGTGGGGRGGGLDTFGGGEGRSPRGSPGGVQNEDRAAPNPFDGDSDSDGSYSSSDESDVSDGEGSIEANDSALRGGSAHLPRPRGGANPFLDEEDVSSADGARGGGNPFDDDDDYGSVQIYPSASSEVEAKAPAGRAAGPNPFDDDGSDGEIGQSNTEEGDDDSFSGMVDSFRRGPPRLTSSPAAARPSPTEGAVQAKNDDGLLLRGWSSTRPAAEPAVGPRTTPVERETSNQLSGGSPLSPGSQGTGSTYSSGGFEISSVEDGSSGSRYSGSGRSSEAGSPAQEASGNPFDSPSERANIDPFGSPASGGAIVSMEGRSYLLGPSIVSPTRGLQTSDRSEESDEDKADVFERGASNSLTVYEDSVASSAPSSPVPGRPRAAAAHAAITNARAMLLAASNGRWSDGGSEASEEGASVSEFHEEESIPEFLSPRETLAVEYPPSPTLPAANVVIGSDSVSSGSASSLSAPPPAFDSSPRGGTAIIELAYPPSPAALTSTAFPDVRLDSPEEGDP